MCSNDAYRTDAPVYGERDGARVFLRGGIPADLPAIEDDIETLAAFHDRAAAWRDVGDDEFFRVRPNGSDWSPGQHLFHVCLANELALRNVEMIAEGTSSFLVERPAPALLALLVLSTGSMPRGVGRAPRTVVPPARPDPSIVWDTLDGNVAALARVRADLPRVLAARGAVRHRELGPLGAAHWVRFAALHGWHHARIVDELLAA
ncbi:MAG: DinB family protein [Planctomycetota bacterium]